MARTRNPRTRLKTRPASRGKAARPTTGRKRAKPERRRAKAVRRPAKSVRPPAKSARRPVQSPRRPVKSARRPTDRKPAKATRRAVQPRTPVTVRGKASAAAHPRRAAPPRPKAVRTAKSRRPKALGRPPLDRARRLLDDAERLEGAGRFEGAAATAKADRQDDRLTSSAHAGHDALRAELLLHTEASPALTAGDVDAKWQDAYAVGDEAPGGDNPTPDQDRVDDIGKALGIEYEDSQELQGGDEVGERDKHRWELDPASSDDWPHGKK